ncbi:hypothetical protein AB5I41_07680 [Sphingomonas sp. MMS24-JH45]
MDDFGGYVKDSYRAGTIMAALDVSTDPRVGPEELKSYDAGLSRMGGCAARQGRAAGRRARPARCGAADGTARSSSN